MTTDRDYDDWVWTDAPGLSVIHLPRGTASGWTPSALVSLRDMTAAGWTYVQIGEKLGISYKTIQRHAKQNPAVADAIAEGRAARPVEHGVTARYNAGCRCAECTTANTVHQREYKARVRGTEPRRHGLTGYTAYGCRCTTCRGAMTAANRRAHEARMQRVGAA